MFKAIFNKGQLKISFIIVAVIVLMFSVAMVCNAAWPRPDEKKAPPAKAAQAPAAPAGQAAQAAAPAVAPQEPVRPAAPQPSAAELEKRKNMIKAAKEKLNNQIWKIELVQMTAEPTKETFKDTLRFVNNRVESEKLVSEGFPTTNYTVSMSGENIVVWETMQTSEKRGLAFWKGELESGVMRGVLSRHLDEKTVKDYSFSSVGASEKIAEPVKEETPAVAEAPKEKIAETKQAETKEEVQKPEPTKKKLQEEKSKKKK